MAQLESGGESPSSETSTELRRMRRLPALGMGVGATVLGLSSVFMIGIAETPRCGANQALSMSNAAYEIGLPEPTSYIHQTPTPGESCLSENTANGVDAGGSIGIAAGAVVATASLIEYKRRPTAFARQGADILAGEYELLCVNAATDGLHGDLGFGEAPKEKY
ncbi:MAG TPA: hypothetical protein VIM53_03050 [Candidatus Saccharimonadales bacterium]